MSFNLIGGAILNYLYNDIVTHIPIHWLRKTFLRAFNKKIDPSAVVLMHTKIINFWQIEIAANVVINQYCLLDCRRYIIRIQHNTDIGPYTRIWTLGHDPNSPTHELYGKDVNIGHHVWIASGVTILPGADIGDGAVLASAAVIHKPVAPHNIMAGNPAKMVRLRENPLTYELKFNPILQ